MSLFLGEGEDWTLRVSTVFDVPEGGTSGTLTFELPELALREDREISLVPGDVTKTFTFSVPGVSFHGFSSALYYVALYVSFLL